MDTHFYSSRPAKHISSLCCFAACLVLSQPAFSQESVDAESAVVKAAQLDQVVTNRIEQLDSSYQQEVEKLKAALDEAKQTLYENKPSVFDRRSDEAELNRQYQAELMALQKTLNTGKADLYAQQRNAAQQLRLNGVIAPETWAAINATSSVPTEIATDTRTNSISTPSGVDIPRPIDEAAGVGTDNSPAAGEDEQRLGETGQQIAGGEEVRPRSTYYENFTVSCPAEYSVAVTSRVPDTWTPSFASMGMAAGPTEVRRLGGYGERLICHYCTNCDLQTNLFYIHQAPPPGHTCRSLNNGEFECRKEGAYIMSSGQIELEPSQRGDFDPASGRGTNVWWRADSDTEQYLEAINGTKLILHTADANPLACEDALRGNRPQNYPGNVLTTGSQFCYETPQGRFGWFRVVSERGDSPKTIVLYYETWLDRYDRESVF